MFENNSCPELVEELNHQISSESLSNEEKLFTILGETHDCKIQLDQMLHEVTHFRVMAVMELMELCLLYDPELRTCLAKSLSAVQNTEVIIAEHSAVNPRSFREEPHLQTSDPKVPSKDDEGMDFDFMDTKADDVRT